MRALLHLEIRRIAGVIPFVAIMLVFGLAPIVIQPGQGGTVGITFLTMTSVVLVSRIFPFESAGNRADTLVGTLPVTRGQVVASRYLLALSVILVTAALAALVIPNADLPERLGMTAIVAAIPLLNLVVVGPLSSRGCLGQIGPMAPVLPFALLVLLAVFIPDAWKQAAFDVVLNSPALSGGLVIGLLTAIVAASLALSVKWFTQRDL